MRDREVGGMDIVTHDAVGAMCCVRANSRGGAAPREGQGRRRHEGHCQVTRSACSGQQGTDGSGLRVGTAIQAGTGGQPSWLAEHASLAVPWPFCQIWKWSAVLYPRDGWRHPGGQPRQTAPRSTARGWVDVRATTSVAATPTISRLVVIVELRLRLY